MAVFMQMKRIEGQGARDLFEWEGEEQICFKKWKMLSFVLNQSSQSIFSAPLNGRVSETRRVKKSHFFLLHL